MRRSMVGLAIALGACGASPSRNGESVDVRAVALAPATVTEPQALSVSGVTTGPDGRATPYGVSGGDPMAGLDGPTLDPTYAFTPANPARVGGVDDDSNPESGEESFLNALWGPQGQPIYYERLGSCCPQPDVGMLDAFALVYEGLHGEPLVVYLDAYHREPLHAPVGLRAAPPLSVLAADP